jgi:hypothetical protein
MSGFLKCLHCHEPLDECDLVTEGIAAVKKIQRLVTTGKCPSCQAFLSVTWVCEDIEQGPAMFEAEEELQL